MRRVPVNALVRAFRHTPRVLACRSPLRLSGAPRIVLLVFPGDDDAVCERARHPLGYYRYNLAYSNLHGLVAKASSKSHSAFLRPLGSRFTEVSAPNSMLVSSYVPSTRV